MKLKTALRRFTRRDQPNDKQTPAQTTSKKNSKSPQRKQRSNHTSGRLAIRAVPYLFSSSRRTDLPVFDNYIKSVAYNYRGREPKYADVSWQSQVVQLAPEDVDDDKKHSFITFVSLVTQLADAPDSI